MPCPLYPFALYSSLKQQKQQISDRPPGVVCYPENRLLCLVDTLTKSFVPLVLAKAFLLSTHVHLPPRIFIHSSIHPSIQSSLMPLSGRIHFSKSIFFIKKKMSVAERTKIIVRTFVFIVCREVSMINVRMWDLDCLFGASSFMFFLFL